VNLQQFYLEWFLVDRILELGHAELRWKNRITAVEARGDVVRLTVQTPGGDYAIDCDWLIDASGANSPIRGYLGVEPRTSQSADRWCITDVRFDKALAIERWTWVSAPFNEGRAVWQHLMADGVWRMDYQMPPDADPEKISRPEVAGQRIRRQLGPDVTFEFVWIGPYQYRDALLDRFRLGRVLFIGDSAHVVSPFGARGGNTGIQDANNLGWKFALVLTGQAPERLLDSYEVERRAAAAENLQVTSRTARFLAPRSAAERTIRDALLTLARRYAFARTMVNTGRMSVANDYPASAWLPAGGKSLPNVPLVDGHGRQTSLMALLRGATRLLALRFASPQDAADGSAVAALRQAVASLPVAVIDVLGPAGNARNGGSGHGGRGSPSDPAAGSGNAGPSEVVQDRDDRLRELLSAPSGSIVLLRPDAYCAARLEAGDPESLRRAVRTALRSDAPATPPPGERADAAAEA
jgi:3-(3-hydroxy-phenyl)propionate hydroxylase